MFSRKELEYSKDLTGKVDVAARKPNTQTLLEIMFAGIQAASGAALAVYTYKNSESRIWPIVYSVIATGGTCNVFRSILKIFWRSACRKDRSCSARNVVTGTIIYFTSVYAFSEAWKCNDKLWIPCLGVAASGYCFAVSSINNLKRFSTLKPLLKLCQLAFEPALIVCGTIYLLYFRNHEEECLYWLPLVVTGATGLKFAARGFNRRESVKEPKVLLLKAIDILMGGCLLTISGTVLAVYSSIKEFHQSWSAFMTGMSLFGVLAIFGSITCFQRYVGMDEQVSCCLGGMITGPVIFLSACLMVKFMDNNSMVYFMFLILTGSGHGVLWASVYELYKLVPRPVFHRYCQRVLGPLLTVYSSVASAYVGYHIGWRFSLAMMTFVPAGIYVTCKGFRRRGETL